MSLSAKELRAIYGMPSERAVKKDIGYIDKHAANFISKSPFMVISTVSSSGFLDASPRGGNPGFVQYSAQRLFIPDYKGNNRVDSLMNIVETGQIGLLFLIPGIDETLRVNGKAKITTSTQVLEKFTQESKLPISCIQVEVKEVFLHCAKAFMRSKLWSKEAITNPDDFPSMGQMLKDQLNSSQPAETRNEMQKRYQQDL